MNAEYSMHRMTRKILQALPLYLLFLFYFILLVVAAGVFCTGDCLIFGPEQIVGPRNCGYQDDGSFYYTNPIGMLFRHLLYMLLIAVLTWFPAMRCDSRCPRTTPVLSGFKKSLRRPLFACLFAGIFIGIGSGILTFTHQRDAELWKSVSAFHSLTQYENYFGEAKYHAPQVNEEQFAQLVQNPRMCDREFALGKELYVFSSAWPFRRFFVWLENGRQIKTTWCGGW